MFGIKAIGAMITASLCCGIIWMFAVFADEFFVNFDRGHENS